MNWNARTATMAPWQLQAEIEKLERQLKLADTLAAACRVKYYAELAHDLEKYLEAREGK